MSSLTLPQWPTAPLAGDQQAFRSWLLTATQNGGPHFGFNRERIHRVIVPLAIQAELGRGCNGMVLEALAAGPEHLPQRMTVASERILDCLEFATHAGRGLVDDLSRRMVTPIDSEDLLKLSRLFVGGIELLAHVTGTAALVSFAEAPLQAIHTCVAESLAVSASALAHLGNRDLIHLSCVQLMEQHEKAKRFSRDYFTQLLRAADSPNQAFAAIAVRDGYTRLVAHVGASADALYHTALKNG